MEPPLPKVIGDWSGSSYSVGATRELYAVRLDTGEADHTELWVLHLSQLVEHRPDKLVRGRIPRVLASDSFEAQLEEFDFSRATLTPGTWTLELSEEGLFHYTAGSKTPQPEHWESSAYAPRTGPQAIELLRAPWAVVLAPLDGSGNRHFIVSVDDQGLLHAAVGACVLKGKLRPLLPSDWFDLSFGLSGCGSPADGTTLKGMGKVVRLGASVAGFTRLRFIGAAVSPDGKSGMSFSGKPALQ